MSQDAVVKAVEESRQELDDILHSFEAWINKKKEALNEITGKESPEELKERVASIGYDEELEAVLRTISSFPSSLKHLSNLSRTKNQIVPLSGQQAAGAAEDVISADGKLLLRRTTATQGAVIQHDWALFVCRLSDGLLSLYEYESKPEPNIEIDLSKYVFEYAGGEGEKCGLKDFYLKEVRDRPSNLMEGSSAQEVSRRGRWWVAGLIPFQSYFSASSKAGASEQDHVDFECELCFRATSHEEARWWRDRLEPFLAKRSELVAMEGNECKVGVGPEATNEVNIQDVELALSDIEKFDVWETCEQLKKRSLMSPQRQNLHDRFVELYNLDTSLFDRLLPQFCNLVVDAKLNSQNKDLVNALEDWLLWKASSNVLFACLLCWSLESCSKSYGAREGSFIFSAVTDKSSRERLQDSYRLFRIHAENVCFTGKRIGSLQAGQVRPNSEVVSGETDMKETESTREDGEDQSEQGQQPEQSHAAAARPMSDPSAAEALERTRRMNLANEMRRFVSELCAVSSNLAGIPKDARPLKLQELLRSIQDRLPTGAFFPLCSSGASFSAVMSIFPEEASCFSTYERAPYALFIETVDSGIALGDCCAMFGGDPDALAFIQQLELDQARESVESSTEDVVPTADLSDAHQSMSVLAVGSDGTNSLLLDEVFGEPWALKKLKMRRQSRLGRHPSWSLHAVIVKSGDDLRQEQFAMQMIEEIKEIWEEDKLHLRLKPYKIVSVSENSGLMEMIPDTVSLAAVRRKYSKYTSLANFYREAFGEEGTLSRINAQQNFVRSMAAYSVICYILKVKDRHDGNILLQRDGGIVHVDYGYMMGKYMNGVVEVERAPFKLTRDHVETMGGELSANFLSYISLCIQGLQSLRKNGKRLTSLAKGMLFSDTRLGSSLQCLSQREVLELEERLGTSQSEKQLVEKFITLQSQALGSWSTTAYDLLQTFIGT